MTTKSFPTVQKEQRTEVSSHVHLILSQSQLGDWQKAEWCKAKNLRAKLTWKWTTPQKCIYTVIWTKYFWRKTTTVNTLWAVTVTQSNWNGGGEKSASLLPQWVRFLCSLCSRAMGWQRLKCGVWPDLSLKRHYQLQERSIPTSNTAELTALHEGPCTSCCGQPALSPPVFHPLRSKYLTHCFGLRSLSL